MRLDDDGSCAAPRPLTCVFSTNETVCARGEAHCRWLEKQARLRARKLAAGHAIAGARERWQQLFPNAAHSIGRGRAAAKPQADYCNLYQPPEVQPPGVLCRGPLKTALCDQLPSTRPAAEPTCTTPLAYEAFVIAMVNTTRGARRLRTMRRALAAAGLEAVAWPATVLNATAALGENRPLKRVTSEREFKETKRTSLFLSWLRLLLHVATRPTPALYALFEDDAPPQPSFADAVRRMVATLRCAPDPTLIRLDCWGPNAWVTRQHGDSPTFRSSGARCDGGVGRNETVWGPCQCGGTHALLLSPLAAHHLVEYYCRVNFAPHTDCSLAEMPSSRRPRKGALSQVCLNSGWPSQLFNASTGPGLHRRRRPYSPRAPLACGLGAPSEAFSI